MSSSSIKEINTLLKEINRLLSKGMWNIYLKATIDKKWRTQNFDYIIYHWIFKLLVGT